MRNNDSINVPATQVLVHVLKILIIKYPFVEFSGVTAIKSDENKKCRNRAGPGAPVLVDLAQNSGSGKMPIRPISCLTLESVYVWLMTHPSAETARKMADQRRACLDGPKTFWKNSAVTSEVL